MTWVIDASIAVKWVIPEVLSDRADRLRSGEDDLLAPDLLLVEVANTLWKKTVSREISSLEADGAFDDETVERLRRLATRRGRPQSQVVREAVKDYDARSGKLSDAERQAMLEAFERLVLTGPRRSPEDVAAELREIRETRRNWGRRSRPTG